MNKIVEIKFGSYLYGTNTPNSDLDYKGIYLPTAREIVLEEVRRNISIARPKREFEKNTKDDVDTEIFSLKEYLRLLCDGQTVALDMLFAPDSFQVFKGSDYHVFEFIYQHKDKFLSKNVTAFYHYALRQAAKYGVKGSRVRAIKNAIDFFSQFNINSRLIEFKDQLDKFVIEEDDEHVTYVEILGPQQKLIPHLQICQRKFPFTVIVKEVVQTLNKIYDAYGQRAILAEKNEGVDQKACSHAVRVNLEAKELLLTGYITFPCPERQLLLDIKTGKMPYNEVEKLIESGLKELEEAQNVSTLRVEPDLQFAQDFIYDIYSNIVKKG